jgi:hypothetical protein
MEKMFDRKSVQEKFLAMLLLVLGFLTFAYVAGDLEWITDTQLFTDLLCSILAFFIGCLALVRYYTKKSSLRYLFLGIGFLAAGVIESVQILFSIESFLELFSSFHFYEQSCCFNRLLLNYSPLFLWNYHEVSLMFLLIFCLLLP